MFLLLLIILEMYFFQIELFDYQQPKQKIVNQQEQKLYMQKLQVIAQKVDFFSSPFSFLLGGQKKKQTSAGGFLTIAALSLSLVYLCYLLILYFDNKLLPKKTQKMVNKTTRQEIYQNQSMFGFTFNTGGKTLKQLQPQGGLQYLIFQAQYQYSTSLTSNYINIPIIECQDPNFDGYQCLDFTNQPEQVKTLFLDPSQISMSMYSLTIQPCQGQPNCASPADISNQIISNNFSFFLKLKVSQYNEQTKSVEDSFIIENLYFDDSLSFISYYSLTQTITTVNNGILFQISNIYNYLSGFTKSVSYFSQNNLQQKAGFTGYAQLQFYLDQNQSQDQIQFPLITEVLAQFMPIFNILIALGILAKLFAESKIIEDISELYIRVYCKSTALKLLNAESIGQSKNINDSRSNNAQQKNSDPLNKFDNSQRSLLTAEKVYQLQNQLDEKPENEKSQILKKGFIQFLKQMLLNLFNKDSTKKSIYQQVYSQAEKFVDIYEMYESLFQVKKAIKLLLSKDQYAALQFCGCDMNFDVFSDKNTNKIQHNSQKIVNQDIFQNLKNENQEQHQNQQLVLERISQTQENKQNLQERAQLIQIRKKEEKDIELQQNIYQRDQSDNSSPIQNQDQIIEEQSKTQIKLIKDQEKNDLQQYLQVKNIFFSSKNHLEDQDQMINDKHKLFKHLKFFIDKVHKNENLSQVDLNIFSSLIGQSDFSQQDHILNKFQLNDYQNQ
ncbi:hypothetical protein ABPG74_020278 [Tetrahymena malaccensis]